MGIKRLQLLLVLGRICSDFSYLNPFFFDNVDPDQNIVDLNPQDWVQLGRI